MRDQFQNVLAFGLVAIFAIAFISQIRAVGQFLGSIGNLSPGHSPQEQGLGLIALLVVTIGFIVAVRALSRNRKP